MSQRSTRVRRNEVSDIRTLHLVSQTHTNVNAAPDGAAMTIADRGGALRALAFP